MHKKGRKYQLQNIPDDIFNFLIKEQAKHKLASGSSQFGLEPTIYKLLREYIRCRQETDFKP